ncbi:hypothetical protein [Vaginisenegalia massiliensis]|uniref:hypothetical protein n=1 Tax=Vaginisenegalia massiliensis TaxID=2058294 RepID=UPI000F5395FB|nr:hypothetical protein [Vaginisenegalia massiliensis]
MNKRSILLSASILLLMGPGFATAQELSKTDSSSETSQAADATTSESSSTESSTIDWAPAEAALKEKLEAKELNQLFSSEGLVEDLSKDNIDYKINGYALYEATEFSKDFSIQFGDQTDKGGILLVDVTVKNNSDKPVSTGVNGHAEITGIDTYFTDNSDIMSDDLSWFRKTMDAQNVLEPNQEFHGIMAIAIKPDALEKAKENGIINFETHYINEKDSTDPTTEIIKPKLIQLATSSQGQEAATAAKSFYEDKATSDNMGTKTMIKEYSKPQTDTFEDIDVTINGTQIVDFEPNEEEAARFENFKDGTVLVTSDVVIKNNSEKELQFGTTSGKLTLNDSVYMLNEGMLQHSTTETLKPGEEKQMYLVFAMSKDDYELYKDRSFVIQVNLYDKEFATINTGDELSFTIQ